MIFVFTVCCPIFRILTAVINIHTHARIHTHKYLYKYIHTSNIYVNVAMVNLILLKYNLSRDTINYNNVLTIYRVNYVLIIL